jgi:hypothetical protein
MRDLLASAIKKIGANSGIGSYIKDGFGTAKPFDALQAKKRFGNDSSATNAESSSGPSEESTCAM